MTTAPRVLAVGVYERTVGAGLPGHERVNRTRATHLGIVDNDDLAAAGNDRSQRLMRLGTGLTASEKWSEYATPHGGEARQADSTD